VPEYPEIEALRELLEARVSGQTVARAGPTHLAILKTIDPPLNSLEGATLGAPLRRGKPLLFPVSAADLVLHVHQMSAGRISVLKLGVTGPKRPAFSLTLEFGERLVMTEHGSKKRARVGLYRTGALDEGLSHLGPEAYDITDDALADALGAESRRLHSFLRDQRALAGIGCAWANQILNRSKLSPYALSGKLGADEVRRLGVAIRSSLSEGPDARRAGKSDKQVYTVYKRLDETCPTCAAALAQVDFEEHTIFYCQPARPTDGCSRIGDYPEFFGSSTTKQSLTMDVVLPRVLSTRRAAATPNSRISVPPRTPRAFSWIG